MVWAYSSIPSSFCRLFVLIEVTLCIRLIKVACTIYSCDNGCFHCAPAPNKKRLLNFLSQQRCSIKKGFLKISQNSQENTCARVSYLIKLQAPPATLLKKTLWHRCFPVNFAKFLRTLFLQNTSGQLLLIILLTIICFQVY